MQKDVALSDIVPNPFQPRQQFDPAAIKSLADEIEAEGFWQTSLQGRRNARGKVELVAGHRRLRALRLLKTASVKIEILDLTDAQMALRALEENLQREGLSDLEKADAVRRAVEIERDMRKAAGQPERGAIEVVAKRLGLADTWVSKLCNISRGMPRKVREVVESGAMTAQTAFEAQEFGGEAYVKTLAKQSKASADGSVGKPTHMTVKAMKSAVAKAPARVQAQLKEDIVSGKIERPDEVEMRARRLESVQVRKSKEPPPDLKVVIDEWTDELTEWNAKLKTVLPYMDYIDELPPLAKRFRKALEDFVETAKEVLKASR